VKISPGHLANQWLGHGLRRWSIILGGVIAAYAVVGFFVVPPIARAQLEKRGTAALHRPVTVAKVRCNPFAMSATVDGLRVADHDGGELASWTRAYLNVDPLMSLFTWRWRIKSVRLVEPRQRIRIAQDGTLNIADLLPPTAGKPAPEAGPLNVPAVAIGSLRIENWSVDFTDESRRSPFHTIAGPMTFELQKFSTAPDAAGPYVFAGASDTTERFAWSGTISAAPAGSKGRVEFQNISLPQHMPFLEPFFGGEIQRGRVSFAVNYDVAAGATPIARITDTSVIVDDLGLGRRDAEETETAVGWKRLEIELSEADLLARTANVTRVALTGFDGHVQRTAAGEIDVLRLLPNAPAKATTEEDAPDSGVAASIRVAEVSVIDARVRLTDHTTPRTGTFLLDQIHVTVSNLGTDLDREIKLDARTRWCGTGELTATGTARIHPLAAAIDVEGRDLALRPLDTWIEPFADIRIQSGTENFRGRVELAHPPGQELALTWTGDTHVRDLRVNDGATGGELLAWESLSHTNTHFNFSPLEITVGEIALVAPSARIAIDETGALNVGYVIAPSATAEAAPPAAAAATPESPPRTTTSGALAAATQRSLPFSAKIDTVSIQGGRVAVTDRSLPSAFHTELRDLGGTIRGLSSAELARADVDLSGSLDGVAPLHVKGTINPLANDRCSDVSVTFSNIDLPLFTPYSGKYLGKKIEKGKLRVDLGYKLSQNSLTAENHIELDQFYLGEPVATNEAIKLPIGLALALLRDREGRIHLDVPVRGNLDDPEFKYGRVVAQVIGNVITKAATAPFAMLGSMFGGRQEEDLSYVEFASGSVEFSEDTTRKLATLAKALFERPALRIQIIAPASPDGDRAGLREQRLTELLSAEQRFVAANADASSVATAPEEIALRRLFARQFPGEAAAALATASRSTEDSLASAEPHQTKRPGLIERVMDTLFGRDEERIARDTSRPTEASAPTDNAPPPLTAEEIRQQLLDSIDLTPADFQELANRRARVVRDQLLADGTVAVERVFLATDPVVPEGASNATEGGRVFFGLE
jgi:uncharacterized protein involved in outer membrane biogenesis